jgi:hypothetical protein
MRKNAELLSKSLANARRIGNPVTIKVYRYDGKPAVLPGRGEAAKVAYKQLAQNGEQRRALVEIMRNKPGFSCPKMSFSALAISTYGPAGKLP